MLLSLSLELLSPLKSFKFYYLNNINSLNHEHERETYIALVN